MRKRITQGIAIVLVVLLLILLHPSSRYLVIGWLKQEQFFRGWPTSYWSQALKDSDIAKQMDNGSNSEMPLTLADRLHLSHRQRMWLGFPKGQAVDPLLYDRDPQAVPMLVELLRNEDADIRLLAAYGLGRFGPEASEAVPALVVALQDGEGRCRRRVAEALGFIGPQARASVPALNRVVCDEGEEFEIRKEAARAIRLIKEDVFGMGRTD